MLENDKCEYNNGVLVNSLMQHSKDTRGYLHLGIYKYLSNLNNNNTNKRKSKKKKYNNNFYDATWRGNYRNGRNSKNNNCFK